MFLKNNTKIHLENSYKVCLPCPSDKMRNVMEIQVRLSLCVDRLGEVFPIQVGNIISFPILSFSTSPFHNTAIGSMQCGLSFNLHFSSFSLSP